MRARSSKKKRTIKQKYNNKKERNASLVRARILQRLHLRKRQSKTSLANNPQPKRWQYESSNSCLEMIRVWIITTRSLGVSIVTLYNNAIGLIGLIDGGYMNDEQRIQLAVEEFANYGLRSPRRWSQKFGGIKLSDFDAPHRLKSSYSACRRQVEACIPKQDGDQLETYALRL